MKEKIQPQYHEVQVQCVCGESFITGTTKKTDVIKAEICNKCHPFFTGKQKMVDKDGRAQRFNKKFGR